MPLPRFIFEVTSPQFEPRTIEVMSNSMNLAAWIAGHSYLISFNILGERTPIDVQLKGIKDATQ